MQLFYKYIFCSLSGGSLTSPVKMKPTIMDSLTTEAVSAKLDLGGGQDSSKNKNHSLGHFGGSSHYAKIRENLRSIYNVHKQSMEEKHFEVRRAEQKSSFPILTPFSSLILVSETPSGTLERSDLSLLDPGALGRELHREEHGGAVGISEDQSQH